MTSGANGPGQGWYLDPTDPTMQRWWDGSAWSQHTHPVQSSNGDYPRDVGSAPQAKPTLRLIRTAADAELVAAEWMRWMGYTDAHCTPSGPDGGLDVIATQAVAQVKLHGRPIGRPDLQKLYGAALGIQSLFFAAEGFTEEAVAWAASVDMALFRFDRQGEPTPANHLAQLMMSRSEHQGQGGYGPAAVARPTMALPISCSDDAVTAMIVNQRTGRLSNKESVDWIVQSWILLYLVRLDYTQEVGRRRQIRQAAVSIYFSSLTGRLFPFQAPPAVIDSAYSAQGATPITPRMSASACVKETVELWNRYIELRQPAARTRYEGQLRARGIPVGIAKRIGLTTETEVLLPIFVGQLSHRTGGRLVIVDGCAGRILPDESVEMTGRLSQVAAELSSAGARRLDPSQGSSGPV